METKLTEEQIEAAAKAAYNARVNDPDGWSNLGTSQTTAKDYWRKAVTAAAPFLQFPLEPPTDEEGARALPCSLNTRSTLEDFVNRRNAARLPKTDPRREVDKSRLAYAGVPREKLDAATDELLKALGPTEGRA